MTECDLCHGNHFIRNDDMTTRRCPKCLGDDEPLRSKILRQADALINGDRQDAYGPPAKNFQCIADIWNAGSDEKLEAWQAALRMAEMKIARLKGPKPSWDSMRDGIGYLALLAELWVTMGGGDDDE